MLTEEIIFKHPPVTDVTLGVVFPNNFDVADDRGRFFNLVRSEFPNVIIPERSKLTYDFADYTLQRHDTSEKIEIGMNYLRLSSVRYPGFENFTTHS